MLRRLFLILFVFLGFFNLGVQAQPQNSEHPPLKVDEFKRLEIPKLTNYLVDYADVVPQSLEDSINLDLKKFQDQSGSQIFILTVPSTNPEDIVEYGVRVFENWKAGRAEYDDGVLYLVAVNDRKHRLEIGKGLEGRIPDVVAISILDDVVKPYFVKSDYAGGINAAVGSIKKLILQEELPKPSNSSTTESVDRPLGFFGIFIPLIVGLLIGVVFHPTIGGIVSYALSPVGFIGSIFIALFVFMVASGFRSMADPLTALGSKNGSRTSRGRRGSHWGGFGGGGFGEGGFGGGGFGGGVGGSSGGGGATSGW